RFPTTDPQMPRSIGPDACSAIARRMGTERASESRLARDPSTRANGVRSPAASQMDCFFASMSGKPSVTAASVFRHDVVGIAVEPALLGLSRGNHRVPDRVRVLGRVPIRRVVAAERRAALLTRPQMHPLGADLHARLALSAFRTLDSF